MNFSARQAKILTANWLNWAPSACWIASTQTLSSRPPPLNGARVVEVLKARVPKETPAQAAVTATGAVNEVFSSPYTKEEPLTATLSVNQKITGRDSEKDVRHIEIDLGDSGLRYQPGDALGVWYQNDPALVKELVELLWLKGDEPVSVDGKTLPLSEALQWHFELTVNTGNIVENYATLTRSESLLPLVGDKAKLQHYAATTPIVDMVRFSPAQLDATALIGLLRPLTPRLYSIASSQAEVETEVHVTVGVVRYDIEGRARGWGIELPRRSRGRRGRSACVHRT
jgi:sulfite reductase (NADPH) flavoprotein alpha-component